MPDRELLQSALSTTKDCLRVEDLEALAASEASNPQDPRIKHLANCAHCRVELALLKTFLNGEPLPDEGASVAWVSAEMERRLPQITGGKSRAAPAGLSWWSRLWKTRSGRFVLATAAFAAVAVTVAVWLRPSEPALIADAGGEVRVLRSEQIANLRPAGDVPRKPFDLHWQLVKNATSYKVEVMEVDETVMWSGQSSTGAVSLPIQVRDKILPGKPILWRVAALAANGTRIAVSQTERFRVIPSP